MTASPLDAVVDRIEGLAALDVPAKPLAKKVRGLLGPGVKDVLSGRQIGHALHPLLTDVVIGTWTSATLLDLIGGRDAGGAAEKLIAIGIAAYPPTAATGTHDWADGEPASDAVRRSGVAHALLNGASLALYTASLVQRRRGNRGRGVALALAGAGTLTAGGHLGGHLSYRLGQGVDQTVFDPGPAEWTAALPADELPAAGPVQGQAGDTPVVLVRQGSRIAALHDRCSHRGCSLASGEVEDGAIACPCHGSRFDLDTGAVLQGPATAPQPALEARERAGTIEVRRA